MAPGITHLDVHLILCNSHVAFLLGHVTTFFSPGPVEMMGPYSSSSSLQFGSADACGEGRGRTFKIISIMATISLCLGEKG